ncbi:hypothetical protein BKA65DRAFT_610647 [Rhexocercosporidium sp. MPI-PUGE-AT-0058]|nr:hypothetical protein BKA65DRAFT_610647 [Rhexocercosporidium sp. MPI-PUGE-AT-0058]
MADILPFSANITQETLIASARLHNRFAPDTAFPQIDVLFDGFKELWYWTRLTRISDIDLEKIHPHIISVDAASRITEGEKRNALLFPSEFREGPLAEKIIEFSFDVGSLLLKEEEVKAEVRGQFEFQVTGWTIMIKNKAVKHTGEIQCVKYEDEHRPIAIPDEVTKVSDIVKILRDQGILAKRSWWARTRRRF